jgi:hypothetical protein
MDTQQKCFCSIKTLVQNSTKVGAPRVEVKKCFGTSLNNITPWF